MGRIENMFKQMMERNADSDAHIASHTTSIRNLEVQMGQISQALNTRPKGALPSNTVVNPKGGNNTGHAMAVTTRSSKGRDASTSNPKKIMSDDVVLQENDDIQANDEHVNNEVRIDIDDNMEETQNDVNPPRKHVIDIPKMVVPKAKTPLPRPPPPYPQSLAKQNNKNQFNKFIEMMKIDYEVPIMLGRPFLAPGKELVDVEAGERTFRVGNEKVVFHVCKSMRKPNSNEVFSFVDLVTEVIVDDTSAMINVEDPLEVVLLNHEDNEKEGLIECANTLQGIGSYSYGPRKLSLDLENRKTPPTKPSIEEPPTLELKPLPSHLRYEFFGPSSILPIILSACLTNVQVDSTLAVLQRRKRAIGWTLADIRGISPAFCMHKIILEDDAKPSVEHQRRLNEAMQKVVKKEIIKKGSYNQVADHLSHLEEEGRSHDGLEINDPFPDEQLLSESLNGIPWFADVANSLVTDIVPSELSSSQRKKLKRDSLDCYWDEPYLFKICNDGVIRRCVPEEEQMNILDACHSSPYGGHHGGARTTSEVLSCGFYWPTLYKDASELVKRCDECQRAGRISKKDEMPLTTILEIDIFDM
ncbi:uncharacterized protein [Nicotiana tomentosiformis]|uniref:uncharacterized protein n=1 Tax=Nicotiana tomentosiformis TaxID=4098 RepID=UPI00388C8FAB